MSGRDRNQREALISEYLNDSRQGLNTQFSLADLLRQSVYSRLAGYEDLNDAVRVSADPTFRLIGSPKRWDRGAALTSTLHWFETELLTHEENLVGLRAVNRELLAQAEMATRADRIVLDMDSSESPVHGHRKGARITGTLNPSATTRCFCSMTRATAWPPRCGPATCRAPTTGTTSSCRRLTDSRERGGAWRSGRTRRSPGRRSTRRSSNATWTMPFACRRTKRWSWRSKTSSFVPPGRPSCKPLVRYKSFRYQAKSWTTARRIVAKVEHHRGELFPRVGFIVTNMVLPSRSVVRFYNKRGTAEQWITT